MANSHGYDDAGGQGDLSVVDGSGHGPTDDSHAHTHLATQLPEWLVSALRTDPDVRESLLEALNSNSSYHGFSVDFPELPQLMNFLEAQTERRQADPPPPMHYSYIQGTVIWPKNRLPVEIFEEIASYLNKSHLRILRLVSKEFDVKISPCYFRNVIVPFKAELYTSLAQGGDGLHLLRPNAAMSDGLRIFQSFGPHIVKFTLSLQFNERNLTWPPPKPHQQAIPAFWGIYRWPHSTYARYRDIKNMERTADETSAMAEALKYLVRTVTLGICCDAGLGFLIGPDRPDRPERSVWSNFVPRPSSNVEDLEEVEYAFTADTVHPRSTMSMSEFKQLVLDQMVSNAGYAGSQTQESIQILLGTEGTTIESIDFDERILHISGVNGHASSSLAQHGTEGTTIVSVGSPETVNSHGLYPIAQRDTAALNDSLGRDSKGQKYPLVPANLSRTQKEMLLELEWAQRAMIQSFVIGVIDNAAQGAFASLQNLNISKIPSSHVSLLCRDGFWNNLPSLSKVTLGVIADWREVKQSSPGCINDEPVSPLKAVPDVFTLLNKYIGPVRNIKHLQFEWICGGEFASGSFQRNNYILPAPIFADTLAMTARPVVNAQDPCSLKLPWITHLSLRNCWSSPGVFFQFVHTMASASLGTLDLETVSFCGPPSRLSQSPATNPVPNHDNPWELAHASAAETDETHTLHDQPGAISLDEIELKQPDPLSWAGFIETFGPSVKIRDQLPPRDDHDDEDSPVPLLAPWHSQILPSRYSAPYSDTYNPVELRNLSFVSCGYVSVEDWRINSRYVVPSLIRYNFTVEPCRKHLRPLMQDHRHLHFGRIAPSMGLVEEVQLTRGFGLQLGWPSEYRVERLRANADGEEFPGSGRFSGTLRA